MLSKRIPYNIFRGTGCWRTVHTGAYKQAPRSPRHVLITPLVVGGATICYLHTTRRRNEAAQHETGRPRQVPLTDLARSYIVYSMCSIPLFVEWSPSILSVLSSVPVLRQITEAAVRHTFFRQFVGGESAADTMPILTAMRLSNKGALLAYSVEVDENEATTDHANPADTSSTVSSAHKHNVEEMIRCIDAAAAFEDDISAVGDPDQPRRTWVALKLTALLPSVHSLTKLSNHIITTRPHLPAIPFPGLPHYTDLDVLDIYKKNVASGIPSTDIHNLVNLRDDLIRICTRAQERGVKVIIDAEYSWYQPAIDAYALMLMKRFNKRVSAAGSTSFLWRLFGIQSTYSRSDSSPLIYATYQAYLRRTPEHLRASIKDAEEHGYALGVKLVRGAYHPHELRYYTNATSTQHRMPPVWTEKFETDECYDQCISLLISSVQRAITFKGPDMGVLFGTHNRASVQRILAELRKSNLVQVTSDGTGNGAPALLMNREVVDRVAIGQLFGMSDELTDYIATHVTCSSPFVIKYVPYGALSEVMPYLSRRAIENTSVLGGTNGALEERKVAGHALWQRIWGGAT